MTSRWLTAAALALTAALPLAGCGGADSKAAEKYNSALERIEQKDYAAAVNLLAEAAELKGDDLHIRTALGQCLNQLERFDEAVEQLGKALKIDPGHAIALRAIARSFRDLGRLDAADQYASRALAVEPDSFTGALLVAEIAYRRGDFKRAEARARQLIQTHPDEPVLHFILGEALSAAGRDAQAVDAYARALDDRPLNVAWAERHQDSLVFSGQAAEAERHYGGLADANPDSAAALYLHARVLPVARSEQKLARLTKAVKLDPAFVRARNEIVNLHMMLGKLDDAKEALDKLFAEATPNVDSHYLRGLYRRRVGRYDGAVADLHKGAGSPVLQPGRHLELVRTYIECERYDDGRALLDVLSRRLAADGGPRVLLWRARLSAAEGEYEKADGFYTTLLGRAAGAGTIATAHFDRAKLALSRGQYDAAAGHATTAAAAETDPAMAAEITLWRGIARYLGGRQNDAVADWQVVATQEAATKLVLAAVAALLHPQQATELETLASGTQLRYDRANDALFLRALAAEIGGQSDAAIRGYRAAAAASRGVDFPKRLAEERLRSVSAAASQPVG